MRFFIQSMRPRTLLLSCSSVVVGAFLAYSNGFFSWNIFILLLLTASLLQVLSNLVNELGDWKKGTDKDQQFRKPLSLQNNKLSEKQFGCFIMATALLAMGSGLLLLRVALGSLLQVDSFFFLILGTLSLLAAVLYSVGKKPYGYHGMGDLAVFVFFGPVAVVGSYYLMARIPEGEVYYIAGAMGLFSTAVLNVNNIRDFENDKKHGKKTFAVLLSYVGKENTTKPAKWYQYLLIGGAFFCSGFYVWSSGFCGCLFLPSLPFFICHLMLVKRSNGRLMDKALLLLIMGIGVYALSFVLYALLF